MPHRAKLNLEVKVHIIEQYLLGEAGLSGIVKCYPKSPNYGVLLWYHIPDLKQFSE